jgi:hypothetical protein
VAILLVHHPDHKPLILGLTRELARNSSRANACCYGRRPVLTFLVGVGLESIQQVKKIAHLRSESNAVRTLSIRQTSRRYIGETADTMRRLQTAICRLLEALLTDRDQKLTRQGTMVA